jgi:di/tripeptidase
MACNRTENIMNTNSKAKRHIGPFLPLSLLATSFLIACASSSEESYTEEQLDEIAAARYVCDEACVVEVFKDFSKVYRPSYGESAARTWVKNEVTKALPAWRSRRSQVTVSEDHSTDAANHDIVNLVVRVPGTYGYKNRKPIALQAHLDMIFAAKAAMPGQPLDPFFTAGVDVVEDDAKDGMGAPILDDKGKPIRVLHSRDFNTTLGADDGQGVAQLIRYVRQPSLPHPPLELVFTSAEEPGLVGAINYDVVALPLQAAAMISLDASSAVDVKSPRVLADPLNILVGANGGIIVSEDAKLPASVVGASSKRVQISLSGLKGGHSGNDIGFKRMNAVRALSEILLQSSTVDPNTQLVDVAVGDYVAKRGQNRIANAFKATISLSSTTDLNSFKSAIESFFATYSSTFTDEVAASVKLEIIVAPAPATPQGALSAALTSSFATALKAMPQGIQLTDPIFPSAAKSSSNLGFLGLDDKVAEKAVVFGYLPRSYEIALAQALNAQTHGLFQGVIQLGGIMFDAANVTKVTSIELQPWFVPDSAKVLTLAKSVETDSGVKMIKGNVILGGGTEPGEFMKKFPRLKDRVIGFGPVIVQAHTVNETMVVQSFRDSTTALQKIIVAWAKDPTLLY